MFLRFLFTLGGDGGSIPLRQDLVKLKSKSEVIDPDVVQRIRWSSCALSKLTLQAPIVADELGNLFNKEALVRGLIDKDIPEEFRHIRSLKDVFDVKFTSAPKKNDKADSEALLDTPNFICPISMIEVGHIPFCAFRKCGCVVSNRGMREVATAEANSSSTATTASTSNSTSATTTTTTSTADGGEAAHHKSLTLKRCPQCSTAIDDATRDIVQLNVASDVYEAARAKLLQRIETERRERAARKATASSSNASTKRKEADAEHSSTTTTAAVDANAVSKKAKTIAGALVATAEAKVASAEKQSEVFKSLFNKNNEPQRETFACRAISGRYF